MRLALAEAARAEATGDVPVGAVVVDAEGDVLGSGCNAREASGDPTAHAEVLALRAAAQRRGEWRLSGCSLVVTLEPCTMCAGALMLARVDRLIFGAFDPKAGAVGSLWDVVRDRRLNVRPEVVGGVLADECGTLLQRVLRGPPGHVPTVGWTRLIAPTGPLLCSAVACPSGLRSTPRNVVWGQLHRGFKSHRHRQVVSQETTKDPNSPRGFGSLAFRGSRTCLESVPQPHFRGRERGSRTAAGAASRTRRTAGAPATFPRSRTWLTHRPRRWLRAGRGPRAGRPPGRRHRRRP